MEQQIPQRAIINTYIETECALENIPKFIPYCPDHESVWSPALTDVIQSTCSQLDSLWNLKARQSQYTKKGNLNIKYYFHYFGEKLSDKWVVFYGEQPILIKPFKEWINIENYNLDSHPMNTPTWWKAHQDIKHNRFHNIQKSRLDYAVHSLAALFIVVLSSGLCNDMLFQTDWLRGQGVSPNHFSDEADFSLPSPKTAESELFTLVAKTDLHGLKNQPHWEWSSFAYSQRFSDWLEGYVNSK